MRLSSRNSVQQQQQEQQRSACGASLCAAFAHASPCVTTPDLCVWSRRSEIARSEIARSRRSELIKKVRTFGALDRHERDELAELDADLQMGDDIC